LVIRPYLNNGIVIVETIRLYPHRYKHNMNTIVRTGVFDAWLSKLKDVRAKALIIKRIRSAERDNFGDCEPVGAGVSEMRIHFGPGYRVYFTRAGDVVYTLLCGGTKRSQKRDIVKAKELARSLKEI
jgi:putative addiction module killer protein